MPLIESSYRPPWWLRSGHGLSIVPAVWRRVPELNAVRERIATPDADFLDLDIVRQGAPRVAILSHGLEGSSQSVYIRGMARALGRAGWDVIAWNCRGCSGELNRQLRFYHSGASEDLAVVVDHALAQSTWQEVALVGFSLGGNMTLKYLGERGAAVDPRIRTAVTFSVPCDLTASSERLAHWSNRLYMERFMRTLRAKVREKAPRFPGQLATAGLEAMRTFADFDEHYTAPLHGFAGARDYWARCGSIRFLDAIRVRTLLVNARDDPFLAGRCWPEDVARDHAWLHLETPKHGGHVGFVGRGGGSDDEYWSETRAVTFLNR
ncbi:YheT family hydrolase [Actomonas aquatica]|uniref:Alpha/beta fold hydrolase n=1 Tax=Actomonas aquatica TaxID=2866162 RepID=A0ABZ1C6T7_9BACT|nr:alpha/beta fold hydrolase [Opitutus sp. WL0086]WRQ87231.1 alpha/beta fold hydrolase [Opitutus sp. WL0086]